MDIPKEWKATLEEVSELSAALTISPGRPIQILHLADQLEATAIEAIANQAARAMSRFDALSMAPRHFRLVFEYGDVYLIPGNNQVSLVIVTGESRRISDDVLSKLQQTLNQHPAFESNGSA